MHDLQSLNQYAKELRADLPGEVFLRNPARLLWLPFHLAVIFTAAGGLLLLDLSLAARIGLSLIIGHSYGVLGFLGHEILHGSIVKGNRLQNWVGGLCLVPYLLGPVHWRTWHNKFHHCHTTATEDPDSFGNVRLHRAHPILREILKFAPGSGYLRSYLFLSFWLSTQALWVLFAHSKQFNYWPPERRRRQLQLFVGLVGFWLAVLVAAGPWQFLFLYILPMAVANTLQMAYISTNHLLSDETEHVNDPLANSLSVRVPWWMNWLHLNFSYHVEHHIFPAMSPRYAPRVQSAIQDRYGGRYRILPLWKALATLYRTPRVHLDRSELVDMRTGDVYSTLGENAALPQHIGQVPVPVRPRRRSDNVEEPTVNTANGKKDDQQTELPDHLIPFPTAEEDATGIASSAA